MNLGASRKIITIIIVSAVLFISALAGLFAIQNLFLDWKMLDVMYTNKAGVSWWATFTLNGFLFTVGLPLAAIITLAGPWHESKVLNLIWFSGRIGTQRRPSRLLVVGWKLLLFVGSYLLLTFVFVENMRMFALLFLASNSGVGSWGQIAQALTLIFNPMVPVKL